MTTATRTDHVAAIIDISALNLSVGHRPVISASSDLVRARSGSLEEVRCAIAEGFGPDGEWCYVGNDLHTVSIGDAEIRLRLQSDTASWHADYFGAGWESSRYACVPAERRAEIAVYVDCTKGLKAGLVQESDLRAAAAEGGFPAVDRLVRRHIALMDEWYAALDSLHGALLTSAGALPAWALEFVRGEGEDLNSAREWLTSAVVDYHHGTAGRRPDTLFGGVCFVFSTGSVDLLR
ncbi:hypothetical protein [Streptomyces sp. 7N604]|uniref:hypothetical protein n=1 Tax=Streptomyces sp. 7N604 TaxID=3457415 RepID=UPI003FD26BAD